MVAVMTGNGLGLSTGVQTGGQSNMGRAGQSDAAYINSVTGNLVIQQQDEYLANLGVDLGLIRTYNSQGTVDGDNNDNWRIGVYRRVYGLTGTANTAGSTITHTYGDGAEVTFAYEASRGLYVSTLGDGAHDTLQYTAAGSTWTYSDGNSQITEIYTSDSANSWRLTQIKDADSNITSYTYTGSLLTSITTADGQSITLVYTGNNLTQIDTTSNSVLQTRVKYFYDASNRLTQVVVDLNLADGFVLQDTRNNSTGAAGADGLYDSVTGATYVTSYTYDGTSKRVASITNGDGTSVSFTYDTSNRIASVKDGTGQITTYTYDGSAGGSVTNVNANTAALVTTEIQTTTISGTLDTAALTTGTGSSTTTLTTNSSALVTQETVTVPYAYNLNTSLLTSSGGGAWSGASLLETYATATTAANDPKVAFDSNGNGFAIWRQSGELFLRRYTAATNTWSAAVSLDSRTNTTYSPTLAVDAAGNAIVAWVQSNGSANSVYANYFNVATQSWSGATLLETTNLAAATGSGSVTADIRNGLAVVSWLQADGTSNSVYAARYTSGIWSVAALLETRTNAAAQPAVAIDANGNVSVVWQQSDGSANSIYVNRYTTSTNSWSGASLLETYATATTAGNDPKVALDANGNGFAIWRQAGELFMRRYSAATNTWSTTVSLDARTNTTYSSSLAVDAAGNAIVAWVQSNGSANSVYANYFNVFTQSWSGATLIETTNLAAATGSGSVAVDIRNGLAVVSWLQTDGTRNNLYAARYTNGTWSAAELLEGSTNVAATPTVAIDAAGNVASVWRQSNGSANSIYVNRYTTGSGGGSAGYTVKSGDTWTSIGATLYGSNTVATSLQTLLGNVPAAGTFITTLPASTQGTTTQLQSVTPYYLIVSGDTWASIAQKVYGVSDTATINALQTALGYASGAAVPAVGTHLLVPSTLSVTISGTITYYLVKSNDTWSSIAQTLYGTTSVAPELQAALGNPTLSTGLQLTALPASLSHTSTGTVNVTPYYVVVSGDTWAGLTQKVYGVSDAATISALQTALGYASGSAVPVVGTHLVVPNPLSVSSGVGTTLTGTTITDVLGNQTKYLYDAQLRLKEILAPAISGVSFVTAYQYDAADNITTVISGTQTEVEAYLTDGLTTNRKTLQVTSYQYDSRGNRTQSQDLLGNTITYTYTAANQLQNETQYLMPDPDGNGALLPSNPITTRYVYDVENHLRFIVSSEGRVTEYRYNTNGTRANAITYTANTYNVSALTPTQTLAEAQLTTWVSGITDKSTATRSDYVYDFRGQVQSVTSYGSVDTAGNGVADSTRSISYFVYDQRGQLLQTIDGRASGIILSASNPQPLANTTNYATTYTYDGLGRLLTSTQWVSGTSLRTTTSAYDDVGNKLATTLANGLTTTRSYDQRGLLVSVAQSNGATALGAATYHYDADGRLRYVTDPLGKNTHTVYDADGRVVGVVDATGYLTETMYNSAGHVSQVKAFATPVSAASLSLLNTDVAGFAANLDISQIRPTADVANDRITRTFYDKAGRAVMVIVPTDTNATQGYVTQNFYDGAGRVTDMVQYAAAINLSTLPADALVDDVIVATNAADRHQRTFYGNDGLMQGSLDGEGYLTENTYDSAGRLVKTTAYALATMATLRTTGTFAQLKSSITANVAYNSAQDRSAYTFYNAKNQVIGQLSAEGYLTTTAYDAAGHVIQGQTYNTPITYTTQTLAQLITTSGAPAQWSVRTYNGANQVTSVTHYPDNVQTTYDYDSVGNLIRTVAGINTSEVRTARTRYDVQGRVTDELSGEGSAALDALVNPSQAQIDAVWNQYALHHTYNAAGQRIKTMAQNGQTTWMYYDDAGRLKATVHSSDGGLDANGATLTNAGEVSVVTYNAFGQAIDTTAYANRINTSTLTGGNYSSLAALITTNANDSSSKVNYTLRGAVREAIDALGYRRQTTYTAFGEVDTIRTQNNTTPNYGVLTLDASNSAGTKAVYDHRGQVLDTYADIDLLNRHTQTVHDAFGRVTDVYVNGVRQQHLDYNNDGVGRQVVTTVDALGYNTVTTYDAFGRTLSVRDKNNQTYSYIYDDTTRSVTLTTPEGIQTKTIHNAHGETVEIVDGNNIHTTYIYNKNGQLTDTYVDPTGLNLHTHTTYDLSGRVYQSLDANGTVTQFTYDAANRVLTRSVDPTGLNIMTKYRYDAKGNQWHVSDANNIVTTSTFDKNGQVTDIAVDPTGLNLRTHYSFDGVGNTLTVTQGYGTTEARTTEYRYDSLNRRTQTIVDPQGFALTTQYLYDDHDNIVAMTEAQGTADARTTCYVYDTRNQITHSVDALGNVSTHAYDANGNHTQVVQYANAISLTGLGTTLTASDISSRLTVAASADQTTRYAYDHDNRLTYTVNALNFVNYSQYDDAGNVTRTVAYYDAINASTLSATATAADVAQALADRVAPQSARDQITQYIYDAANRMTAITRAFGTPDQFTETYAYDAVGNQIRHTNGRGHSEYFAYDAAGREQRHIDQLGYVVDSSYDDNSNLRTKTTYMNAVALPGVADDYWAYAGHAPNPVVDSNPISGDRTITYTYDNANRLETRTDPGINGAPGVVTHYLYDSLGRVTDTIEAEGLTEQRRVTRVYDALDRLIEEILENDSPTPPVESPAPGMWQNSELVSTNNAANATTPQVAINTQGHALAVWVQSDGVHFNLWANYKDPLGGWHGAQLIETNDLGEIGSTDFRVVMDNSGNAIVVWQQSGGATNNIYTNVYRVGQGWQGTEIISSSSLSDAYLPDIAFDGSGNAMVVWEQFDGTYTRVLSSRYVMGLGWQGPQYLTSFIGDTYEPHVAMDVNGNMVVTWHQSEGGRRNLYANRYVVGQGWLGATLLENSSLGHVRGHQVAMDANGNAVAVWVQTDGTENSLWANYFRAGQGWQGAQLIETTVPGYMFSDEFSLAMDTQGNALVVWSQDDGTVSNIYAQVYRTGQGWQGLQLLETAAGGAFRPHVAMDAAGNALVVWDQYDGTITQVVTNRYLAGQGFQGAQVLSTNTLTNEGMAPQVAMDTSGNAIVVWAQVGGPIGTSIYIAGLGWQGAALLDSGFVGSIRDTHTTVAVNGDSVTVWVQSDGISDIILARYRVGGQAWASAVQVTSATAGGITDLHIATDANGNATAVWRQSDGTGSRVYASVGPAGQPWQAPMLLDSGVGSITNPNIAVDESGRVFVIWTQFNGTTYQVMMNRLLVGQGWLGAQVVDSGANGVTDTSVQVDAGGDALVSWRRFDGIRNDLYVRQYTDGQGFLTTQLLESSNADVKAVSVAVDRLGNNMVVWIQSDGVADSLWSSYRPTGQSFQGAVLVETGNLPITPGQFDVALNSNGNAVIVWQQFDGTTYSVYANVYSASQGFGGATLIGSSAFGCYQPHVVLAGNGEATVVWRQSTGTVTQIVARRYVPNQGWQVTQLLEGALLGSSYSPELAIDNAGSITVTWLQQDGATVSAYVKRFAAAVVSQPPVQPAVTDQIIHRYAYDANGNQTAIIDPRGVELAESNSTWALAERLRLGYVFTDVTGTRAKLVSELLVPEQDALRMRYTTNQMFDLLNRKTSVTDALGNITQTQYDAFGNIVKVIDPKNSIGYFYYDALNRATFQVDPEGYATKTVYDVFGNAVDTYKYANKVQGSYNETSQIQIVATIPSTEPYLIIDAEHDQHTGGEYDALNRTITIIDAETHTERFRYDAEGNVIQKTDKNSNVTSYEYDARSNRIAEHLPITSAVAEWGTTEFPKSQQFGLPNHTDGYPYEPKLVYDNNGNGIIVWYENTISGYKAYANYYVNGSGWQSPQWIQDIPGAAYFVDVVMDSQGNAVVVWAQASSTSQYVPLTRIYSNRYIAGTGWQGQELLQTVSNGAVSKPRIAIDDNDNIIAWWSQNDGGLVSIYSNRYENGQGWQGALLVPLPETSSLPQLQFDAQGNLYAIWTKIDSVLLTGSIFAIRYVVGQGWEAPALLSNIPGYIYTGGQNFTVDSQGNAVAVWMQYSPGESYYSIYANRYVAGTGWQGAVLLETLSSNVTSVSIAGDNVGNAVVVYTQQDGTLYKTNLIRFNVGAGWRSTELLGSSSTYLQNARVSLSNQGDILATWIDGNKLYTRNYLNDLGWQPTQLMENSVSTYESSVTVNEAGNFSVVWAQGVGVGGLRNIAVREFTNTLPVENRYEYDAIGNVSRKIEADGLPEQRITQYVYDKRGRLHTELGETVSIYDPLTGQSMQKQLQNTTEYNSFGDVVEKTDANGIKTHYYYDRNGRQSATVDGERYLTVFSYDPAGNQLIERIYEDRVPVNINLAAQPDPQSIPGMDATRYRERYYQYDSKNQLVETRSQAVLVYDHDEVVTQVDGNGNVVVLPNPAGHVQQLVTSIQYDSTGNVVCTTDANGNKTYLYYNRTGNRILQVDPLGYVISWDYDGKGNLIQENKYTLALDPVTFASLSVTSNSEMLRSGVVSGEARITTFAYDRMNRKVAERRLGVSYTNVNMLNGALTGQTGDVVTQYEHDGLGNITAVIKPDGSRENYSYDELGRRTQEQGAVFTDYQNANVRITTQHAYDGLGNVVVENRVGTSAADLQTHRYFYDASGRLARDIDPGGVEIQYAYDANGNMLVKSENRTQPDGSVTPIETHYRYDNLNRQVATIDATGISHEAVYDAYGEIIRKGMNGLNQEINIYDAAGRLVLTNKDDGVYRAYLYDANSNETARIQSAEQDVDLSPSAAQPLSLAEIASLSSQLVQRTESVYDARNQLTEVHSAPIEFQYEHAQVQEVWVDVKDNPFLGGTIRVEVPNVGEPAKLDFDTGRREAEALQLWLWPVGGARPPTPINVPKWLPGHFRYDWTGLAAGEYEYEYKVLDGTTKVIDYLRGRMTVPAQSTPYLEPEQLITDPNNAALAPSVVADGQGNMLLVWYEHEGQAGNTGPAWIKARRYIAGQGWEAATTTVGSVGTMYGAIAPNVKMLPDGEAIIVWEQSLTGQFTTWNVLARRYDLTTNTWSAVDVIASNIHASGLSMDSRGNSLVSFSNSSVRRFDVELGIWRDPEPLNISISLEAIDHDAHGNAFIAGTVNGQIVVQRYNAATASWQAAMNIGATGALDIRIASSANGNATVVWATSSAVYASSYDVNLNTWGTIQTIKTGIQYFPFSLNLVRNSNGDALLTYGVATGVGALEVHASVYSAGGGIWQTGRLISTESGTWKADARPAIFENGTAMVVWRHSPGSATGDDLYANRYVPNVGWEGARRFATNVATTPAVGMDSAGNSIIAFPADNAITGFEMHAARYVVPVPTIHTQLQQQFVSVPDPAAGSALRSNTIVRSQTLNAFGQVVTEIDGRGNALATSDADWAREERLQRGYAQYIADLSENGKAALRAIYTTTFVYNDIGQLIRKVDPIVQITLDNGSIVSSRPAASDTGQPIGWTSPFLLESDNVGNATVPRVELDAQGNGVATWLQSNGTRTLVYASRRSGGVWGIPRQIDLGLAGNASEVQLALDATGNAIIVWRQVDAGSNVYVARLVAGVWQAPFLLGGNAANPRVAVNGGHAMVTWEANGLTYSRYFDSVSGWQPAVTIQPNGQPALAAQIAFDPQGQVVAVWQQNDAGTYNIYAGRFIPGQGWQSAQNIDASSALYALNPQLGIDGQGNIIAVWELFDGTQYNIYASRYTQASGWSAPTLLGAGALGDARTPRIAVNGAGDAMVVWNVTQFTTSGGTSAVITAFYDRITGWQASQGMGSGTVTDVAIDTEGNATVVWERNSSISWPIVIPGQYDIWSNRYIRGIGWQTSLLLESDTAGHANAAQVAVDAQGNVVSVWQQSDGVRTNILSCTYHNHVADTQYYYDINGRTVGQQDANGNLSVQRFNQANMLVAEYHDASIGGVREYGYDVFGNKRFSENEYNYRTYLTYDKKKQLVRIDRPTDSTFNNVERHEEFRYNEAGYRIAHRNASGYWEYTYYDSIDRVSRAVSYAGLETAYDYLFDSQTGNSTTVTRTGNTTRTLEDTKNYFGQLLQHRDLAGRVFTYTYNLAGWLTHQAGTNGQNIDFSYYHNGYQKSVLDHVLQSLAEYEYDVNGNRIGERYAQRSGDTAQWQYFQWARVDYDAMNRVVRVIDPRFTIEYEYDAVGNRRRVLAHYYDGLGNTEQTQEYWYAYDAMNRFTITKGSKQGDRGNATIVEGQDGYRISYDQASRRTGANNETYSYNVDGLLYETRIDGVVRARRLYDASGNAQDLYEYNASGNETRHAHYIYTRDGNVDTETTGDVSTKYNYDAEGNLETVVTTQPGATVTNRYTYEYWDSAKQFEIKIQGQTTSYASNWAPGFSFFNYDINGHLTRVSDIVGNRNLSYTLNHDGLILRRNEVVDGFESRTQSYYYLDGKGIGDAGGFGSSRTDYTTMLANRDQEPDYSGKPVSSADFDYNYMPINDTYPATTPGSYIARLGDTLQSVALSVWGDSSLWYLIADANGLGDNPKLIPGQRLVIPNVVANIHNSASTFHVYNPGEILGNTSPTLPDAPPPPPPPTQGGGGCGVIGIILMVVVAIVVTIFTAGAALAVIAPAGATIVGGASVAAASTFAVGTAALTGGIAAGVGATLGATLAVGAATIAAAAVGSAAGSIASQLVGMATGNVQEFSWGAVATSALTGGLTAGIGSAFGQAGLAGQITGINNPSAWQNLALNGAINNIAGQGINMLTGQQEKFSWKSVAVSAIAAPISSKIDNYFGTAGTTGKEWSLDSLGRNILAEGTKSVVRQGLSVLVNRGGKIQWQQVAADAFGNGISNTLKAHLQHEDVAAAREEAWAQQQFANWDADMKAIDDERWANEQFDKRDKELNGLQWRTGTDSAATSEGPSGLGLLTRQQPGFGLGLYDVAPGDDYFGFGGPAPNKTLGSNFATSSGIEPFDTDSNDDLPNQSDKESTTPNADPFKIAKQAADLLDNVGDIVKEFDPLNGEKLKFFNQVFKPLDFYEKSTEIGQILADSRNNIESSCNDTYCVNDQGLLYASEKIYNVLRTSIPVVGIVAPVIIDAPNAYAYSYLDNLQSERWLYDFLSGD